MDNLLKDIAVDWHWVESNISSKEKLGNISEGPTKKSILEQLKNALVIAGPEAKPAVSIAKDGIVNSGPASILLESGVSLSGKELSSHMKGASFIYAFLVTIGKGLEDAASAYMNSGDHLMGYLLDRLGSFAVESLAKNAEEILRQRLAAENLSVSMRFSPGYCDWPIEEQFKLAKIINFAEAGVTLTENCMMIPKKSITAIVGVGPEKLFAKVQSPCSVCNMKVCNYRRAG